MRRFMFAVFLFFGQSLIAAQAGNWNACSTDAIYAAADVSVSDGSAFRVETFYRSPEESAIRFHRDSMTTISVEGPFAWSAEDGEISLAPDGMKAFAFGHQFHALLLNFEAAIPDAKPARPVPFGGRVLSGMSGDFPYGGQVHLIRAGEQGQPAGLRLELPDAEPIEVAFSDWREHQGRQLPFRMQIDDGKRMFDYRYTQVDMTPRSPLWFFRTVAGPAPDEVALYRLHRMLLAAHCMGDADLMAELSADEITVASRGELNTVAREDTRKRFGAVFERLDYTEYADLKPPRITVSESGDIAWMAVNLRAAGYEKTSGETFATQWAWVMLARKQDGRWLHAGNASNAREE